MKKTIYLLAFSAFTAAVAPAHAGPAADALNACFADNTTGRDRKEFAKWMFVAMASHPEMKGLANITPANREASSRYLGETFTRLLTQSCANEARTAIQKEGGESVKAAFSTLGRLAMQELTTHPDVNASLGGFESYIDKGKLRSTLPGW